MAGTDKIFGMILVLAGISIAIYYTIWQFLSLVSLFPILLPFDFSPFSQESTRFTTSSWIHIIFLSCQLSLSLQAYF